MFLEQWAWVIWAVLILVFVIIEVSTLEFTFLMLALGSVAGLVAGLLGAPWWVQIIVAGVLAILLLFVVRPALLKALHRGADETPSNMDALLGQRAVALRPFVDGAGQVKLANGDTWTARLVDGAGIRKVDEGRALVVTRIDGATAVVEPAPSERTPS